MTISHSGRGRIVWEIVAEATEAAINLPQGWCRQDWRGGFRTMDCADMGSSLLDPYKEAGQSEDWPLHKRGFQSDAAEEEKGHRTERLCPFAAITR